MPCLNKRGPENMGPMTGKKMGRCVSENVYTGQTDASGYGGGYSRGRGCRRGVGHRGRGFVPSPAFAGPVTPFTKDDLNLRAKALEQELAEIKNELKNLSSAG